PLHSPSARARSRRNANRRSPTSLRSTRDARRRILSRRVPPTASVLRLVPGSPGHRGPSARTPDATSDSAAPGQVCPATTAYERPVRTPRWPLRRGRDARVRRPTLPRPGPGLAAPVPPRAPRGNESRRRGRQGSPAPPSLLPVSTEPRLRLALLLSRGGPTARY